VSYHNFWAWLRPQHPALTTRVLSPTCVTDVRPQPRPRTRAAWHDTARLAVPTPRRVRFFPCFLVVGGFERVVPRGAGPRRPRAKHRCHAMALINDDAIAHSRSIVTVKRAACLSRGPRRVTCQPMSLNFFARPRRSCEAWCATAARARR